MEELIRCIIDNGLGVASFIALLYFANTYIKSQGEVLKAIQDTLATMCENLKDLSGRVETLEKKEENQTNKLNELTGTNKNSQIIEEQKVYAQPAQVMQPQQVHVVEPPVIQQVNQEYYNQNNNVM